MAECVGYVQSRDAKARSDIAWSVFKSGAIDREKLSEAARESHARFHRVAAFRLLQIRKRPPPELPLG